MPESWFSVENDAPFDPLLYRISHPTLEGRDAICDTSATESLRQRRGGLPRTAPIQWETLETAMKMAVYRLDDIYISNLLV